MEESIQISGIQHYMYCRRSWALLYIENMWKDNYLTLDGDAVHEKVHDTNVKESRKDVFYERGVYISSEKYNLSGQCDLIEYHKNKNGILLKGKDDLWVIVPTEYKHGNGDSIDYDKYQLIAQMICLEEMFLTKIEYGYLYYKKSNKRIKIENTEEIKKELKKIISEMQDLMKRKYTPKIRKNKKCKNCSLLEICNPQVSNLKNIKSYMKEVIDEYD